MLRARNVIWVVPLVFAMSASGVRADERPDDAQLKQWVQNALQEDPRVESSKIGIMTGDAIVTLSGAVDNIAAKKYAVLEAEKITGVKGVIDKLVVEPSLRPDADIAEGVRVRLADSPTLGKRNLTVDVVNGAVWLRGAVENWAEKQNAEMLAGEVRGARAVNNELTITYASHRPDEQIRADVLASLTRDVYLVGLPISVTVHDGVVQLRGSVGSAYERERAASAAWVGNVKSVTNNLNVDWWENEGVRKTYPLPSDSDIQKAVRSELYKDLRVEDPFTVTVACDYGHVTLTGSVPTYYQKRLAEEDSKDVVGVGWVTNDLRVDADRRDDVTLKSDIESRFDSDYLINGQDIRIDVKDGVATLGGNTNTYQERSHAVDVASRVPGVVDVTNDISVNWFARYTDEHLKQRIEDRLQQHNATRWIANRVTVKVDDGTAYLTGQVQTWDERKEADRVAIMTDGVKSVDNRLQVAGVNYPWAEWNYPFADLGAYDLYLEPKS
ncbi:MAG: BON domain-containing protein [Phycisphaerales bacterium]|nr:BON domain-containing protein [Phycisphaerales bacterium]